MLAKTILSISTVALVMLVFAASVSEGITARPKPDGNPPPQHDNFSHWPDFGEDQTWRYYIVDGNNGEVSVNGALPFDNSSAEITAGKELHFLQVDDIDFDEEFPAQYNNIFMIGFQGYIPNAARDILWSFAMKIEPDTYGTTGFVIERKDTFAADGTLAIPFDFFGVSYAGPENSNSGLYCSNLDDFATVWQAPIAAANPFEWNAYEIRFHYMDSESVLASITVNDTEVCQTTIENYGKTEVQIWLDNYKVTYDPFNLGYNNKETPQGVFYDDIEAKAAPNN